MTTRTVQAIFAESFILPGLAMLFVESWIHLSDNPRLYFSLIITSVLIAILISIVLTTEATR